MTEFQRIEEMRRSWEPAPSMVDELYRAGLLVQPAAVETQLYRTPDTAGVRYQKCGGGRRRAPHKSMAD